jgi:hypothetical protein
MIPHCAFWPAGRVTNKGNSFRVALSFPPEIGEQAGTVHGEDLLRQMAAATIILIPSVTI